MDHFSVLSDRLSGHEAGDVVTARSLRGANIDALMEAGHLKRSKAEPGKAKTAAEKETEGTMPAQAEMPEGSE